MTLPFRLPSVAGWQLRLALAIAGLGLAFGSGWAINGWRLGNATKSAEIRAKERDLSAAGEQRADEQLVAATGQKIGAAAIERIEAETGFRSRREKSLVEIVKVPVYGQCIVTSDGVRVVNTAVARANAFTAGTNETGKGAPPTK